MVGEIPSLCGTEGEYPTRPVVITLEVEPAVQPSAGREDLQRTLLVR